MNALGCYNIGAIGKTFSKFMIFPTISYQLSLGRQSENQTTRKLIEERVVDIRWDVGVLKRQLTEYGRLS